MNSVLRLAYRVSRFVCALVPRVSCLASHGSSRVSFLASRFSCLASRFLLLLSLSACTDSRTNIDAVQLALSDSLAKMTLATDVDLTLYEGVRAAVHLKAPRASTYEKDQGATETLFSGGVQVELIDSTGQRTNTFSEEVYYLSPESIFSLRKGVVIDGFNERRLRTDTLTWDRNAGKIRTEGFVIMVTESDSIRGFGLRANTDLSDYSVLHVTGSTTIRRRQN
jgi:hypothetical protein